MLKPVNRLKARGEFKRTLAGRRICVNDSFVVYGLAALGNLAGSFSAEKSNHQTFMQPRVGFVVSKKVHKRSVRRNLIKRRLRELVRSYLMSDEKQIFARYRTLVFIARAGSVEASFQDLQQKMARCLQQF